MGQTITASDAVSLNRSEQFDGRRRGHLSEKCDELFAFTFAQRHRSCSRVVRPLRLA